MVRNRAPTRQACGSILPAILVLIVAVMLLGLGALRSAATEVITGASISAARDAFWLAEAGIADGLAFAAKRTAELPVAGSISLPPRMVAGTGRIETVIRVTGSDDQCPALDPLEAERYHYEIQATGFADRSAASTHVQGLYICRSTCDSSDCLAVETAPVTTYWSAKAAPP
ncbi:MAG: hypothetical protein P8Y61_10105 [Gammaproteobacteria bacterium]|jgi:hypothetical protein